MILGWNFSVRRHYPISYTNLWILSLYPAYSMTSWMHLDGHYVTQEDTVVGGPLVYPSGLGIMFLMLMT